MKSPRRRSVPLSSIRQKTTYTIEQAAKLLAVSRNTVRNWLKTGLRPMDNRTRPLLIHGSALYAFHKAKRQARATKCKPGEIYCFKCRDASRPFGLMVDVTFSNQKMTQISALCEVCSTRMNQRCSVAKLAEKLKSYDHVTLVNPRLLDCIPPSLNCHLKETTQPC